MTRGSNVVDFLKRQFNFKHALVEQLICSPIGVWKFKNKVDNEVVESWKAMKADRSIDVAAYMVELFSFANSIAERQAEVTHIEYNGCFPVIEIDLSGKRKENKWFAYMTFANDKTCILHVSKGIGRNIARDRADNWIRGCRNACQHGKPLLVDRRGRGLR